MILSTVRLAISTPHKNEVLRRLWVFMGHAAARAGGVGLWLSPDLANPDSLTITEDWATRDDFDAHAGSAEYRLMLAVIDLSETHSEVSVGDLHSCDHSVEPKRLLDHIHETHELTLAASPEQRQAEKMALIAKEGATSGPYRSCPCGSGVTFRLCHGNGPAIGLQWDERSRAERRAVEEPSDPDAGNE